MCDAMPVLVCFYLLAKIDDASGKIRLYDLSSEQVVLLNRQPHMQWEGLCPYPTFRSLWRLSAVAVLVAGFKDLYANFMLVLG